MYFEEKIFLYFKYTLHNCNLHTAILLTWFPAYINMYVFVHNKQIVKLCCVTSTIPCNEDTCYGVSDAIVEELVTAYYGVSDVIVSMAGFLIMASGIYVHVATCMYCNGVVVYVYISMRKNEHTCYWLARRSFTVQFYYEKCFGLCMVQLRVSGKSDLKKLARCGIVSNSFMTLLTYPWCH